MKQLKPLILFILFLLVTGCATVGPKIVIETPEPAEDIVLVCMKSKDYLINLHSSGYWTDYHSGVVRSGEPFDCGVLITGEHASVKVMHPIYSMSDASFYKKGDVEHIVLNKTKLQLLEEQKAKFEAGYWDKDRWPKSRYADSVKGICWFPYQYFDYYQQERRITLEHFKALYYEPILQCYRRVLPILRKYDKSYKNVKEAEEYVKGFWEPEKWEQFND